MDFFSACVGQRVLTYVIANTTSGHRVSSIPPSRIVAYTISIIVLPVFSDTPFSS